MLCFSAAATLPCTLLTLWDEAQQEVCLLLTDSPPHTISPTWYALRLWIEAGFKALKSGAFQWQRTRMSNPARAERLWLVLAIATLGSLSLADFHSSPTSGSPSQPQPPRLSLLNLSNASLSVLPLAFCIAHYLLLLFA